MATTTGHPGRTLIILGVLIAGLITLMAVSGTWIPKLGLDLRGGTTITLTAKNTTGTGAVDPNSLQLAKTIIQSRVDSLGSANPRSPPPVTTRSSSPCPTSSKTSWSDSSVRLRCCASERSMRLNRYSRRSRRRAATSEPSSGATARPAVSPRWHLRDGQGAPTRAPASEAGNNEPMPALPTAPPVPLDKACVAPDGKGVPPDQALDWQPTEACQAAFAEFTCETKVTEVADQGLFACNQEKTEKYLLGPTLIEGNQLTKAVAGIPQNNVNWVVNLEFNPEGCGGVRTGHAGDLSEERAAEPLRHRSGRSLDLGAIGQRGHSGRPGRNLRQLHPEERD